MSQGLPRRASAAVPAAGAVTGHWIADMLKSLQRSQGPLSALLREGPALLGAAAQTVATREGNASGATTQARFASAPGMPPARTAGHYPAAPALARLPPPPLAAASAGTVGISSPPGVSRVAFSSLAARRTLSPLTEVNEQLRNPEFQRALRAQTAPGEWSHHSRGKWHEDMKAIAALERSLAERVDAIGDRPCSEGQARQERQELVQAQALLAGVRSGLFILGQCLQSPDRAPVSAQSLVRASNARELEVSALDIYSWSRDIGRHHPSLNGAFQLINATLRSNDVLLKRTLEPLISDIARDIDRLPPLGRDAGAQGSMGELHRGLAMPSMAAYAHYRDDLLERLNPGGDRAFADPAFVTASSDRGYPGNVLVRYELPQAASGELMTAGRSTAHINAAGQGEVIFKPGTRFELLSAREYPPGHPERPAAKDPEPNTSGRTVADFADEPLLCVTLRELPTRG